jgi:uncharacterized membrane protein
MNRFVHAGRWMFAIGMAVFGVQYLGYGRFMGGLPPVPPWTPGGAVGAYLVGVVLIAASIGIAINKKGRAAALVIGGLFLVCVVFLHLLHFKAVVLDGNDRTRALEPLALSGAAFVLAAMLSTEGAGTSPSGADASKLVLLGRLIFGASMVVFGAQHFMYAAFIASLVTAWIPWHLFWVYFTGLGMIAAGLAIGLNVLGRLAAIVLGLMFFLWVVVLHTPRVIAQPHNGDELSSLFVALAFSGSSFILAGIMGPKRLEADMPR